MAITKNSKFKQGFYHPKNPEKLIGMDVPFFRSGIERDFFKFLDDNPNVIKWASEPFPIPYFDKIKKKTRNYFVDNYVEIKEGNIISKYLIELKDHKETKTPDPSSKKKKATLLYEQATWVTNNCKWQSCHEFCVKNNMKFLLFGHSKKEGFTPVNLDF